MANPNPSPATRWKKGQSGNPSGLPGRPPVSITAILRRKLAETQSDGRSLAEELVDALLDRARKESDPLVREILNRIDGRVPVAPPPAPEPLNEQLDRLVADIYGEKPGA